MRIEFTHSRTPEYFGALQVPVRKRVARRTLVISVGCAVLGILAVFVYQGDGVATVLGFFALVVASLLPLRLRRALAAMAAVPEGWSNPRTYVITGEALHSSTEMTSSTWRWEVVRRVDELPEAYLFHQDGPVVFDLPREPMTADQDAELRAFLTGRGLRVSAAAG